MLPVTTRALGFSYLPVYMNFIEGSLWFSIIHAYKIATEEEGGEQRGTDGKISTLMKSVFTVVGET